MARKKEELRRMRAKFDELLEAAKNLERMHLDHISSLETRIETVRSVHGELIKSNARSQDEAARRMTALENRVGVLWEAHDRLAHNCTIVGIGINLGERLTGVEDAVKHLRSIVRLLHKGALGLHTEGLPDSIDEPVRNLPLSRKKVADALVSRMAEEPFYTRPQAGIPVAEWAPAIELAVDVAASKRKAKCKPAPAAVEKKPTYIVRKRTRIKMSPAAARKVRNAARRQKRAEARAGKR